MLRERQHFTGFSCQLQVSAAKAETLFGLYFCCINSLEHEDKGKVHWNLCSFTIQTVSQASHNLVEPYLDDGFEDLQLPVGVILS